MLMAFSKNKKVDLMWANTHSIKRSSIRIEQSNNSTSSWHLGGEVQKSTIYLDELMTISEVNLHSITKPWICVRTYLQIRVFFAKKGQLIWYKIMKRKNSNRIWTKKRFLRSKANIDSKYELSQTKPIWHLWPLVTCVNLC